MNFSRKFRVDSVSVLFGLISACAATLAQAQAWPTKPVTVIWPYPPGGSASEVKMRALYNEAARVLGQPFVWDYKPGASARLGVIAVSKAPPDGHMLTFATDTVLTVLPQASASFTAQVDRDYAAVQMPFGIPLVVTGHPRLPFRDIKGWVAYAKANPGKLTFGSTGIGGTAHLSMERIAEALGIQMLHVPYASSPFMPDLLNGTIDIMTFSTTALTSQVNAGKLIGLAQAGPRRTAQLPNVPTLRDAGYDISIETWNALVTAPGTPPEVVAKMNATLNAAQRTPEVARLFAQDESLTFYNSPKEITEHIKAETQRVRPIVLRMNLKFD